MDAGRAARAAREAQLKAGAAAPVRAWMAAERLSFRRAAVRLGYAAESGSSTVRRVATAGAPENVSATAGWPVATIRYRRSPTT